MSKLSGNETFKLLQNLFLKQDSIENLLLQLLILNHKLQNIGQQTFYFKKSIENQQINFETLRKKFEDFRNCVNNIPLDELLENIQIHKEKLEKIKTWQGGKLVQKIALSNSETKISYLENVIAAKAKYKTLDTLETYLNNSEECLAFFEI